MNEEITEFSIQYNESTDSYVTINNEVYSLKEAYDLARKYQEQSNEILQYLDRDIQRGLDR